MSILNSSVLASHQGKQVEIDLSFLARVDAGAVTILGKDYGDDVTYARTGNGVYTITFAEWLKPLIARGWVNVEGNTNVTGNVTYDATTGVATVRLWAQGGGADNTAVTVDVFLRASRSSIVE
jgi:hypothetical protein